MGNLEELHLGRRLRLCNAGNVAMPALDRVVKMAIRIKNEIAKSNHDIIA